MPRLRPLAVVDAFAKVLGIAIRQFVTQLEREMQEASTRVVRNTHVQVIGDGPMPVISGTFGLSAGNLHQLYGSVAFSESAQVEGNVVIDQRFLAGWHWREFGESRFELEVSASVRGGIEFATKRANSRVGGSLSVFVQRMINGSLLIGDHTDGSGVADKQVFINSALSVPLAVEFFGHANNVTEFKLIIEATGSRLEANEENAHLYLWDREVDGVRYVRVFGVTGFHTADLGYLQDS